MRTQLDSAAAFRWNIPSDELSASARTLIYGSNWLCRLDIDQCLQAGSRTNTKALNRKRSHKSLHGSSIGNGSKGVADVESVHLRHDAFGLTTTYRSVLALDFISPFEICVIERPFHDVAASLSKPWQPAKYGT